MTTIPFLSVARNLLPFTRYPYRGAPAACPVCGSADSRSLSRLDRRLKRLSTVMCMRCGLFRTDPMPTDEELEVYYRTYYRFDYQWSTARPGTQHISKRRRDAARRIAQLSDLLPAGARTLDFGAGSGEFVASMLELGNDAHGFEPGENYGNFAREKLGDRIRVTGWQTAGYEAEFDLVTSFHVLEHLKDPVGALTKACAWLRTGGMLYIEVPNTLRGYASKGFGVLHFAHLTGFNHHNLALAAARADFRVERIISPTGVIFRKTDKSQDIEELARRGREETAQALATVDPVRAYIRHHLSKVGLMSRPAHPPLPLLPYHQIEVVKAG